MTNTTKLAKIDKSVVFNPVLNSSMIESYAHTTNDLIVKFKAGAMYKYAGVDSETVKSLESAASKGKYFSANIKNKFVAEQVE